MGFNTTNLGLAGERVSDKFGNLRDGCPHKGTDFTSSRKPKEFTAGIYGKVIATNWNYGTITILPFHEPNYIVQYLHCSEFRVTENEIVQPWTVIGVTGETAPPGTGITGIHLHLQVEAPGTPTHSCWGSRNFTDPEKWDISNPLIGEWITVGNNTSGNQIVEETIIMRIMGDEIGDQVTVLRNKKVQYTRENGHICLITITQNWPDIEILERSTDKIKISVKQGIGSSTSSSSLCVIMPVRANPGLIDLQLIEPNKLKMFPNLIFERASSKNGKMNLSSYANNYGMGQFEEHLVDSTLAELHKE